MPSIDEEDLLVEELMKRLRRGAHVDDATFERALYPTSARMRSATFWTPVEVAQRVANLLGLSAGARVLDVGAGVGKFCIVAASMSEALFVGVEQRAHLVRLASAAALRAQLPNARFVAGDFAVADVTSFDAIYFFNPFEENAWPRDEWLDQTMPLSLDKAGADVERIEAFLAAARPGTRVVTYHGFGGEIPPSYERLVSERCHTGTLEVWRKTV